MKITLSRRQLADAAGYSYRRLHDIDSALPEGEKLFVESEGRKCDLALFVQRWAAYCAKMAAGAAGTTLEDEKARHEKLKADKTEIEVGRMRGEYVDINEIVRLWTNITGVVVNRLVNLPKKLAPQLVMIEDAETAEEIVARDLRDMMAMISNTPLPDENEPPQDDEDKDDGPE